MPPKKRPRLATLDEIKKASSELIDAITAGPLDSKKFIEVVSPDGTLKLYYNTDTLIRIAMTKGGFMQPPHFREPMSASMVSEIERLEGRKFHFGGSSEVVRSDNGYETEITHRHVFFEDIIDRFYLLTRQNVFVCTSCYHHYVSTVYIPYCAENGITVRYIDNGATPVVDPLDVVTHMMTPVENATSHLDADEEDVDAVITREEWDTPAARIVFYKSERWRRHCATFHTADDRASDCRLRDVLCTYYSHYNRLRAEMFDKGILSKESIELSQARYWKLNAGYNRLRYNRIVDVLCEAENHPEVVSGYLFEGQEVDDTVAQRDGDDNDAEDVDDFLASDSECEGDDSFAPRFSPPSSPDDSQEDEEDNSGDSNSRPRKRQRREKQREGSLASSASGSPTSTDSSSCDVDDGEDDDTDSEDQSDDDDDDDSSSSSESTEQGNRVRAERGTLHAWMKQGLTRSRVHPIVDHRMSADERRFYEKGSSTPMSSTLYDPYMQQTFSMRTARDSRPHTQTVSYKKLLNVDPLDAPDNDDDEASDWIYVDENGNPVEKTDVVPKSEKLTPAKMLLDDDE